MANEVKLFSEMLNKSKYFNAALMAGSRSREDAAIRQNTYQKLFSNYTDLKETINSMRTFSGAAEIPLLSNQYFNASVTSYVQSFAGFCAIERAMDQPTMLLQWLDVLGVTDGREVMPNIGPENFANIGAKLATSTAGVTGQALYSILLGQKLIPGSVQVSLIATGQNAIVITDDRQGNLIAAPGILAANISGHANVNYTTGAIEITCGAGFVPATGTSSIAVISYQDSPGTPDTGGTAYPANRFKAGMVNMLMNTAPDMLISEDNLITMAQMKKSLNMNPADFLAGKLIELYTKLINQQIVNTFTGSNYVGSSVGVDITKNTTGFLDFRSQLDKFGAELVNVDDALAAKSIKGVRATAYVCGMTMAGWFKKCAVTGKFVTNAASNYVNDLVGFYDGIPVLRHTSISTNEGYAIHKTFDGQLAPVMRGIYLPLTNTPPVGNYNNPTQVANGVFYQENSQQIVNQLVQKFTVTADA
jgi:hypothetical protein